MNMCTQERQILVVTGLSGAGKSSVMRALEDLGFYCVDNFPVPLLTVFLDFIFKSRTGTVQSNGSNSNVVKVALGIDVRGERFLKDLIGELEKLKKCWGDCALIKIIFLNSSDEVIVKRFQETRRKHPLALGISLHDAIKKERALLKPIEALADEVHFTDQSNIHELRSWVRNAFASQATKEVVVNLISFGFKYGVPAESNLIYDLRFLPNPFFVETLRPLDGRDLRVQAYVFDHEKSQQYWAKLQEFLRYIFECYYQEGRFFANVSFGCNGGKHRSVSFVEKLCVQKWPHVKFLTYHRDVGRE